MRRVVIFALLAILAITILMTMAGCSGTFGTPIAGNGKLQTVTFDYIGFNKLEIDNAFEAELTKSDSFAITITADSNLFDYLDIRKSGSTLHIGLQKNHSYLNTTQKAMITLPDLWDLNVSGASTAQIIGFNSTNALTINVSGAGKLGIKDVKAGNIDIKASGASRVSGNLIMKNGDFNISGASTIELEGTAENINAEISGASSGKLENFTMVKANMIVSGASSTSINVSSKLDANVSGASRLYYTGDPTLGNVQVTGASTFSKK